MDKIKIVGRGLVQKKHFSNSFVCRNTAIAISAENIWKESGYIHKSRKSPDGQRYVNIRRQAVGLKFVGRGFLENLR